MLLFKFHPSNFGAGGGFMPFGIKALFAAIPSAGIVFAYLGFEQADQLAGEIKDPQKNLPRAIIIAVADRHRDLHPAAGRVHRRACPHSLISAHGLGGHTPTTSDQASGRSPAWRASVGLGWLAILLRLDAFVSPFGTGLIYRLRTSRVGYGLARNRYFPQIFARVGQATASRGSA